MRARAPRSLLAAAAALAPACASAGAGASAPPGRVSAAPVPAHAPAPAATERAYVDAARRAARALAAADAEGDARAYLRAALALARAEAAAGLAADEPDARAPRLVAAVWAAGLARGAAGAAGAGAEERAALALVEAAALAGLGFDGRAAERAAAARVGDAAELPRALERLDVPPPARPWAVLALHLARRGDALAAYRAAVVAIEGPARLGAALPPSEVERLARWIAEEAGVRFVCPESGTPWLPGRTASPVSGVPHLEYVIAREPPLR